MKKLISLLMVFIMLICIVAMGSFGASALPMYTEGADLSYYEEIMPHFYPEIFEGRTDFLVYYDMLYAHNADVLEKPEYIVFKAYMGIGNQAFSRDTFGDYVVYNNIMDFPYDLSHYVYVPSQQKVYTLREAWDSEELDITDAFKSGSVGIYTGKEPQYRYLKQFEQTYVDKNNDVLSEVEYKEVYDHFADRSMPLEVDWVLVYGYVSGPTPRQSYAVLGDRVSLSGECSPFAIKYAVYDMKTKVYTDICDIEDFSAYSGLQKQIDKLELGVPIGDADSDSVLTILDATYIQRVAADLCDYSVEDDLGERKSLRGELKYISDYDRDGERTVMDATAIQMMLAGLEI